MNTLPIDYDIGIDHWAQAGKSLRWTSFFLKFGIRQWTIAKIGQFAETVNVLLAIVTSDLLRIPKYLQADIGSKRSIRQFGLEADLRRRSGASLDHAPEAAVPETQKSHCFQRRDPILGHSAV